jgi:hypothetical protein
MKTKYIFFAFIWSHGSGWIQGSKLIKKVKITITMNKANHGKAYDMAYNEANKRGYKNFECIELQETINL